MQKLIFSFCFFFLVSLGFSQTAIYNFTLNSSSNEIVVPQRNIIDNGVTSVKTNYKFANAGIFSTLVNKTNFVQYSIKDFSFLQIPGKPALPAHIDFVAVPDGADYTLVQSFTGKRTTKTAKILPSKKPARDTQGAPEPEFEIDESFYASDIIFPSNPVQIIDVVTLRGVKMLMIQICPIQYNPAKGEIYSYEEINFEVTFSGATHFFNKADYTELSVDLISRFPLNGNSLKNENYSFLKPLNTNSDRFDYIIITKDTYLAAADSLARWKRQLGYTVEIVSNSNWTSSSVKNAIQTRYQNWTPKPDYFVIIGDHQDVPAEIYYDPIDNDPYGSDLYYACMDGGTDYIPDMARGRISVSNANEAMVVMQKIINYERNPIADTSFYKKGINCAQFQDDNLDGYADRRFVHTSEDVRNYMMSKNYQVQRIYYTDANIFPTNYNQGYYSNGQAIPSELSKLNGYLWNGGASNITSAVNNGAFYLLHRDHGFVGGSGWAHPYYVSSNISALNNGNKLPVVFSINCHTGEFTLPTCFAETFLRKSNGGAVGVFGASYYSYSGFNDGLAVGFFDGIWSNPGLLSSYGSGGVAYPNVSAHPDILTMGNVLNHGLTRMIQTWGGGQNEIIYQHRLFHYFGDPAMKIWKSNPQNITLSHNSSVSCSDTSFAISNCSFLNATATLTSNGMLLGKITLTNGVGTIPLSGVTGSNAILTISGSGYRPYIASIAITSGGSMSLIGNITHVKCKNTNTGKIHALPSCGVAPYTYTWSSGDSTEIIQNKIAGTYIVTVTDNNQSSVVDTFIINEPTQLLNVSSTVENIKCFFESNGKIILTPSGGNPPYTFLWNGGSGAQSRLNLSAGNYSVTVTDAFGCALTKSFVITQPSALILNTIENHDNLNNCTGSSNVIAQGGKTPYQYLWDDPNHQTTPTATNLCAGNYKITVTDSNNCLKYRTVFINNTVGLEENNSEMEFLVYPNPSESGIFNVEISNSTFSDLQMVVYDVFGQKLKEEKLISNSLIQVNLQNFSSGIYFVQFRTENQVIGEKVLIKN